MAELRPPADSCNKVNKPALIEVHRGVRLLLLNSITVMVAFSVPGSSSAPKEPGLRRWVAGRVCAPFLAAETIRSINGTAKTMVELRYFLTSVTDAPEVLARAIRKHWTIGNNLHWVLDVTFREDKSRVRDRIAARNLTVPLKITLNLISRDPLSKTSKRGKRKQAGWNDKYMLQLLRT
ncbi:MAG: ISAs1 family transposase [Janthinobacterium lividum]